MLNAVCKIIVFIILTHAKSSFCAEVIKNRKCKHFSLFCLFVGCGWWVDRSIQARQRLGSAGPHQLFYPVLRLQRWELFFPFYKFFIITSRHFNLGSLLHRFLSHLTRAKNKNVSLIFLYTGTVRIEMFRNMQNAEIIRKMTEEFDEVYFFPFLFQRKTIQCIIV